MDDLLFDKLSPDQIRHVLGRLASTNPGIESKLIDMARASREAQIDLARRDPNVFMSLVLKDEETGDPITQAPIHRKYQQMVTDNDRCVIHGHVESGKSYQLSVGRVLWELGRNPDLRVVICQRTATNAKKTLRSIAAYIESSPELHEVFPHLRPGKTWGAESIIIDRPNKTIRDPSVAVLGTNGSILGARIDFLVLDDILDGDNTRTDKGRNDTYRWLKSTLLGRVTGEGRIVFIGNAWHPDDAMYRFAAEGWPHGVFRVRDPDTGESNWAEKWPQKRIAFAFSDKGFGPLEAARQLDCVARSESVARFKLEWIKRCMRLGLQYNARFYANSLQITHKENGVEVQGPPPGAYFFTGVDLGVGKELNHDWTVLFTIMVYPDGKIQVVNIQSGKWSSPDIVEKIRTVHKAFGSKVLVESNAAQKYIVDFVKDGDDNVRFPVYSFTTRGTKTVANKHHPEFGVEGIAAELAGGRWIIPCPFPDEQMLNDARDDIGTWDMEDDLATWVRNMLYFDPLGHTGDHLMACFEPGTRVTTRRGPIPIEDVQVGDLVLTHTGSWKPVTGTTKRHYDGRVRDFSPSGLVRMVVTPNHPVYTASPFQDTKGRTNRLGIDPTTLNWVDAEDVRVGRKMAGDWVFTAVPTFPDKAEAVIDLAYATEMGPPKKHGISWVATSERLTHPQSKATMQRYVDVDVDLAMLIGLYLAEGSTSHHQASFTFHDDVVHLHDFVVAMARKFFGASAKAHSNPNTKATAVVVSSTVAKRFFTSFGRRAQTKHIPWDLFWALPKEILLHVVVGWLMGDGHLAKPKRRKSPTFAGLSTSYALLDQMRMVLLANGISPTLHIVNNKPYTPTSVVSPAWQLGINAQDTLRILRTADGLAQHHWDVGRFADLSVREHTNSRSKKFSDVLVGLRVTSNDETFYSGDVYNLHVADDESYCANGMVVHNCWIAREGARRRFSHRLGSVDVVGPEAANRQLLAARAVEDGVLDYHTQTIQEQKAAVMKAAVMDIMSEMGLLGV